MPPACEVGVGVIHRQVGQELLALPALGCSCGWLRVTYGDRWNASCDAAAHLGPPASPLGLYEALSPSWPLITTVVPSVEGAT